MSAPQKLLVDAFQNAWHRADREGRTGHRTEAGIEAVLEVLAATTSPPSVEAEVHRQKLLADAIVKIAVAAGVTDGDVEMTGPEVLLIAEDTAAHVEQQMGRPCGQVSVLLAGRLSGPCVVRGRHTEHRADNGDAWTESVR